MHLSYDGEADVKIADGLFFFGGSQGSDEGKMGIGTTSPMNLLQVSHTGADGDNGILIVREDSTTADNDLLGGIGFDSTDGNVPSSVLEASAGIAAYAAEGHGAGDKGGDLTFFTSPVNQNEDTAAIERMRITAEGAVQGGRPRRFCATDLLVTAQDIHEPEGSDVTIEWDGASATRDTTYFTHTITGTPPSGSEIVIESDGFYNISYNLRWDQTNTNRVTIETVVQRQPKDGSFADIVESKSTKYSRGSGYGDEQNNHLSFWYQFTKGDTIRLNAYYTHADSGTSAVNTVPGGSFFQIVGYPDIDGFA
jgi:hypothetical protein